MKPNAITHYPIFSNWFLVHVIINYLLIYLLFSTVARAGVNNIHDSVEVNRVIPLQQAIKNNNRINVLAAANCYDINWATWNGNSNGSPVNNATGIINTGTSNINVTMSSPNYMFGFTPSIYNYSRVSGYPSTIPNSTVPKTSWSDNAANVSGKTIMSFSQTVNNPVLLLASLGSSNGTQAKLTFSLPYVVIYDGGNMVYNDNYSITGTEGYAIIMFPGEFNSVTISSTTYENYTNITWGIKPQPFPIAISEVDNSCGSVVLSATGGTSYLWSGGDTPNSATNTFHTSGTYVVTVTNASGCTASTSKTIIVQPSMAASISGNTTGCDNVTLTASGGTSYLWSGGDTPNNATNTFHASGNYTVLVGNASGCSNTLNQTITVTPMETPEVSISQSPAGSICMGTPVTFRASIINGGPTPDLLWYKNGTYITTAPSWTVSNLADKDKITCKINSSLPCTAPGIESNELIINVDEAPQVRFDKSDVVITGNEPILLDPIIEGNPVRYIWTPTAGLNNPDIKTPLAYPQATTLYHLKVITAAGCESDADIKVYINKSLNIPNTFTPNGDEINDTWNITGINLLENVVVNIYNRFGVLVFHSVGYPEPWNGKFKGQPVPEGVYYYWINANDEKFRNISGYLTLVR